MEQMTGYANSGNEFQRENGVPFEDFVERGDVSVRIFNCCETPPCARTIGRFVNAYVDLPTC
jgi:hypothetical protein